MALFKILKGSSADFGNTDKTKGPHEGWAYFTEDDGKFYIDIADGETAYVGNNSNEKIGDKSVNRICINQRLFNYNDFDILDCGTAADFDSNVDVIIFDCQ